MSRWLRISLVSAILAGLIAGILVTVFHGSPAGGPTVEDDEGGLVSAVLSAFIFVAVYSIREPWWNNWIGRFIISHILAVACLLLPFVLSFYLNFNRVDNQIAAWVLVSMFYVVAADLLLGTVLWLHLSLKRAHEEAEPAPDEPDK